MGFGGRWGGGVRKCEEASVALFSGAVNTNGRYDYDDAAGTLGSGVTSYLC